jgi:hypothetical protein
MCTAGQALIIDASADTTMLTCIAVCCAHDDIAGLAYRTLVTPTAPSATVVTALVTPCSTKHNVACSKAGLFPLINGGTMLYNTRRALQLKIALWDGHS